MDDQLRAIKTAEDFRDRAKHGDLEAALAPLNRKIGKGKGRDYVETDVPASRLEMVKNPSYGTPELTVKGDLPLKNHTIHRRKEI